MHQIYTVGLPCTLATVTPDNVLRPVHYQAYMQVKLGTCWHQPDSFSLHIFRNTSYEFTHSSKVITLSAFSSRPQPSHWQVCCRGGSAVEGLRGSWPHCNAKKNSHVSSLLLGSDDGQNPVALHILQREHSLVTSALT